MKPWQIIPYPPRNEDGYLVWRIPVEPKPTPKEVLGVFPTLAAAIYAVAQQQDA